MPQLLERSRSPWPQEQEVQDRLHATPIHHLIQQSPYDHGPTIQSRLQTLAPPTANQRGITDCVPAPPPSSGDPIQYLILLLLLVLSTSHNPQRCTPTSTLDAWHCQV